MISIRLALLVHRRSPLQAPVSSLIPCLQNPAFQLVVPAKAFGDLLNLRLYARCSKSSSRSCWPPQPSFALAAGGIPLFGFFPPSTSLFPAAVDRASQSHLHSPISGGEEHLVANPQWLDDVKPRQPPNVPGWTGQGTGDLKGGQYLEMTKNVRNGTRQVIHTQVHGEKFCATSKA
uniref:Uncharacterized protein n=1 Tax=Oryza punctata TaxID=4537 RepID=A0A0E0MEY0_ORYPU